MAVVQMQKISICARKKNRKQLLELLQRQGVIEIQNVEQQEDVFMKIDVQTALNNLEKNVQHAQSALEILGEYEEKKSISSMFEGRKFTSPQEYDGFQEQHDGIAKLCRKIMEIQKEIGQYQGDVEKNRTQAEILVPWMNLDIPVHDEGTQYTSVLVGVLPNEWSEQDLSSELSEFKALHLEVLFASKIQTGIFLVCLKEEQKKLEERLLSLGFASPSAMPNRPPLVLAKEIDAEQQKLAEEIEKAKEEIRSLLVRKEEIQFFHDYETMRVDKYHVIEQLVQSEHVFVLTGYIPQKETQMLKQQLDERFELYVEFEEIGDDEEGPVLLSNNGFSAPLEGTVEGFSPPGKGELDPTFAMSLFYYLLFGLLLSDAAYGAIIAGACLFVLLKYKNIEPGVKNAMKMYLYCGISTMFWGVMFGSYFGDVVDVVSETFFGYKVTIQPLWFFPVNEPMKMLTFAMFLGIIHIFSGMAMKAVQMIKKKQYLDMFYDVGLWYILLISCILLLLSNDMFANVLGVKIPLPGIVAKAISILAMVSALGIIWMGGRESKNPFKRLLKGLYALYGISGYLSDVLSYSRILALGLATGVIATVINKMGSMAGGGIVGAIMFTLIFVFGHTINIAINALGAYVHTTRLQYVEFFGKFYEGGGRKFNPFRVNTKYFKFKEKNI